MRIRVFVVLVGLALVASACSSSSDSGEAATDTGSSVTTTLAAADTSTPEAPTTTAAEPEPAPGGDGTATVSLDNGEEYTFSILCNLESQEAAGQEILFTAVSYDEPYGFDVTQFGKGSDDTAGLLDGLGTISIYDSATFDDVWGAGTVTAQLSETEFMLEVDGSTITGTGTFFTGADVENLNLDNGVPGELVANCG